MKKSDLIPICFLKSKFDWLRGIGQESNFAWKEARLIERNREGIKGTRDFKLKTYFSSSHFDRSKNRHDQSNYKEIEILKKKNSIESFEKLFLWYDMYVHDFKWFSKPNFSKKNSNFIKFPQSFLSSLPKMH